LARGESTSEAAKKFGVTAARISQLRLWLKESWEGFQGEAEEGQVQVAAAS
jgi:transposase-like protein